MCWWFHRREQLSAASLGNDVNLRDVEGRSALLLGKAKDNNAATAIGPFNPFVPHKFDLDTGEKWTSRYRGGNRWLQNDRKLLHFANHAIPLISLARH